MHMTHGQNFIDGRWCDGTAGWIDIENPAIGKNFAVQGLADARCVDRSVPAARRCHEAGDLTCLPPVERGRMVRALGSYLENNLDVFARMLSDETGKPYC